jgi:hypothetical protein
MNRIVYKNDKLHLGTFTPNEDYKLVGKYKGLYIWVDDNEGKFLQMEICTDNNSLGYLFGRKSKSYNRVMLLDLEKSRSRLFKNSYEISMVAIDGRYQGFGLAAKIYRYLMKKTGITLKAGSHQSIGGRAIWNDLAAYKDVQVVGKRSNEFIDMEAGEDQEMSTGIEGINCYDSGTFSAYAYYRDL